MTDTYGQTLRQARDIGAYLAKHGTSRFVRAWGAERVIFGRSLSYAEAHRTVVEFVHYMTGQRPA